MDQLTVDRLDLPRCVYGDALALQHELHAARRTGAIADCLLLTEHEPVLTLGRGADARHLRVPLDQLRARNIDLVPVERGGDVTYHGPGQLVAYPILDLRGYGRDVHRHLRRLEETALRLLARYGLSGRRVPGTPGVWLGERKIASVGVYVAGWTTMHGIAINCAPNLSGFDLIHPCGLIGMRITSIAAATGAACPVDVAADHYAAIFAEVFEVEVRSPDPATAAAALVRAARRDRPPAHARDTTVRSR